MSKKVTFTLILISSLFFISCHKDSTVWIPGWKETSSMTTKRMGSAAVVFNGYIYVMGGINGKDFLKTTEYAKIFEDGSLGPWTQGSSLNEERGFFDAVIHNKSIYVVGGGKGAYGKELLRSVEKASINPDGTLGPWQKEEFAMNIPRRCSKLSLVDNTIFSFGGFGGDLLKTVEHAEILETGKTDEWFEEEESMTVLRYISAVKKVDDIIFVVGGHDPAAGSGIKDVEWSKVADQAGLKKWVQTSPLKEKRYALAAETHNGYLYALGGNTGAKYLRSIEKTKVVPEGALSPWEQTTLLTEQRAMFNAVVYKDWIYVIGGTNNEKYFKSVERATFNKKGDIGFRGEKEDQLAYNQRLEKIKKESLDALSNEGTVEEVLQTENYTYVLILKNTKKQWIAVPKVELPVGARVKYSQGVTMANYYSKKLKRNFKEVIFTGSIQLLEK